MINSLLTDSSFKDPEYLAPSAWVEHIPFAFWLAENLAPKMFVELGVHYGVSYFAFCQALKQNDIPSICYAVDNWKGDEHAGFYSEDIYNQVSSYNSERYGGFSYLLRSEFSEAVNYFSEGSIDLLHIDGYHTYEAVKSDFSLWSSRLSERAIVLFHDTNVREKGFGVFKLWEELAEQYPSFEFKHGYGLGVLAVGKKIESKISFLFNKKFAEDHQKIRKYYKRLGNAFIEKIRLKELISRTTLLEVQLNEISSKETNLYTEIINFKDQIKTKDDEITSLNKLVQNMHEEIEFLKMGLKNSEAKMAAEEQIASELKNQVKEAKREKEIIAQKNDKLTEFLDKTNSQLELLFSEIKDFSKREESLKRELDAFKAGEASHKEELKITENRIENLKSKLDHALDQLKDFSIRFDLKENEIKNADKKIKKLEDSQKIDREDIIVKERSLHEVSAINENLRQVISKNDSEIRSLKNNLATLKNQFGEISQKNSDLNVQIAAIENSRSWKLALFIKSFKGYMFNIIQKCKLAVKAVWWLLTGKFKENFHRGKQALKHPNVPFELIDDYLLLSKSHFFNREWYKERYPDIRITNTDEVLHYLVHGYKEGRDPSRNFSTIKYSSLHKDVADDDVNPLVHYLKHGREEGRKIEPSIVEYVSEVIKTQVEAKPELNRIEFQAKRTTVVLNQKNIEDVLKTGDYEKIKTSGLFDNSWYLKQVPELSHTDIDPVVHYLIAGHLDGINPNPLFDTFWYYQNYPDVKQSNTNALAHYVGQGGMENRDPHPLFRMEWFYEYNKDLKFDGINPLMHYCRQGFGEGRKVHPLFDEQFYCRQTGLNPKETNLLAHYISEGWTENKNPNLFFDNNYYYIHHQKAFNCDPLSHYVQQPFDKKISPSRYFNTEFYTSTGECSNSTAADPLIHFLTKGINLLRRPSMYFRIFDFIQHDAIRNLTQTDDLDKYINNEIDVVYEYIEAKERINFNRKRELETYKPTKPVLFDITNQQEEAQVIKQLKFEKNNDPKVSVIIPYYKAKKYLLECLLSLSEYTHRNLIEVIVVNDKSPDAIEKVLSQINGLNWVSNEKNSGFIKSCNTGASLAKGKYLLFMNNDVQVCENSIENLLAHMESDAKIAITGPKVLYPSGYLQEAGCRIFTDGSTGLIGLNDNPDLDRYNYVRDVDYVSGCSLLISAKIFNEVGGFSEEFAPGYFEDSDLCMKVRAKGYKIQYCPASVIYHHLSASTDEGYKNYQIAKNQGIFFKKWASEIRKLNEVKIIPFYFPQFHPYKENEFWWGKGFTEWTNVTKTLPNFEGHIQPRLPSDLGFCDIRLTEVMEHQKQLAEHYGVSGFCFYYYWFAGKRIMELPIDKILKENKPDFPFCICWANENFTRRWDGGNNEIMLGQDHSDQDDEAVIKDILRYAVHKNYIRINNKPIILLYRFSLFPDIKRTTKTWRKIAREVGVGEVMLGFVESFQHAYLMEDPVEYGFDFSVQFPPHQNSAIIPVPGKLYNEEFEGTVHDYREIVLNYTSKKVPGFRRFPGTMPGWDNTPRQKNKPNIFMQSNPGSFQAWLEYNITTTCEQNAPGERFVFINAWNEWAEGAFLEPSREDGHGYLEAIRNAKHTILI